METTTKPPPGGTVLVVDDDADALCILVRALEAVGYTALTAKGGRECLEIVQSRTVDVILLDVKMPEMDGFEVCRALQKINRASGIPIILVTGKDDVDTRVAGMHLGVSEFLTKPVNLQELVSRVQNQLHAVEIRRQLDQSSQRIGTLEREEAGE
jgi:DNA-binding response OmpR family regulator